MYPAPPQQACRADNTTRERPERRIVTKRGLVAQPAAARPARRSDGGAFGPAPLRSLTGDHGVHLNRAQLPEALLFIVRTGEPGTTGPEVTRPRVLQREPGRTDEDLPPPLLRSGHGVIGHDTI